MQWEFTADEVVRGEVAYGLVEFRRDLLEEVRGNLATDDESWLSYGFDTIYDLCYWIATGREFDDFVATLPADGPFDGPALHAVRACMDDNIAMLGAILQRKIMDGVEQGLPLEAAVENAAQHHATVVAGGAQSLPG